MDVPKFAIRIARQQDSAEITRLAGQLGYPVTENVMRERLCKLVASSNDVVLVAETKDGVLAGWVHGFLSQLLESDFRVEIGGMIVDERCHRQGIGRALVKHIEEWAGGHGVGEVSVRCRTTREEAHQFYQSLGFQAAKTQIAFRKKLS